MQWLPFQHGGGTYDLSHLHSRRYEYVQPEKGGKPARRYKVDVIFSLHCFTRGGKAGETPDPALLYSDHRETRIFDFQRYELSRQLPGIVQKLGGLRCYHTGRENFFTIELVDHNGNKVEYEIYFTASRSSKRGVINLFVQSAYVRDQQHRANRPDKKSINFYVILFNVQNDRPIKPGQ